MSTTSRLVQHPCYELVALANRSHRSSREWTESLKRLEALKGPFGTGKEVATTVYSLSKVPTFVRDRLPITDTLAAQFVQKSISTLSHDMNEASIAISALSVHRSAFLPRTLVVQFGETLCKLNRPTRWSDPRNLAQICFTIGVLPGLPIGVRADALTGWISSAILSFPSQRFKIKDIVQILTGLASHRIQISDQVFDHLENAIMKQVQYCDSAAIGAIFNMFGKLNHEPRNRAVIGALIATSAQQIDSINARSFCGILRGLAHVRLEVSERTTLQLLVDTTLDRVIEDIPIIMLGSTLLNISKIGVTTEKTCLVVEGHVLKFFESLEKLDDLTTQRNASIALIEGCESLGIDARQLMESMSGLSSWIATCSDLDMAHVKLFALALKYRHATFGDSFKRIEHQVIQCPKVSVLLKLLATIANSHDTNSEQAKFLVKTIASRFPDFANELDMEELATFAFQVWMVLGIIPDDILRHMASRSTTSSELVDWMTESLPQIMNTQDKFLVIGRSDLVDRGDCEEFRLWPIPPVFRPQNNRERINRVLSEISRIDPLFVMTHDSVLWYCIKSEYPSVLEKTFAFNDMMEQGKQCVVFIPPTNSSIDREVILDTMQFIANR